MGECGKLIRRRADGNMVSPLALSPHLRNSRVMWPDLTEEVP